jgi:cation transport regulator ChaC
LTLEIINVRLQQQQHRSVTQLGLADDGSAILDKANEYLTLARHFFDRRVEEARIGRQSDTAKVEVAAVAGEAASLKGSIIEYLQSVENALRMIDLRK